MDKGSRRSAVRAPVSPPGVVGVTTLVRRLWPKPESPRSTARVLVERPPIGVVTCSLRLRPLSKSATWVTSTGRVEYGSVGRRLWPWFQAVPLPVRVTSFTAWRAAPPPAARARSRTSRACVYDLRAALGGGAAGWDHAAEAAKRTTAPRACVFDMTASLRWLVVAELSRTRR